MLTIRNQKHLRNGLVLLRLFIGWHFLYEGIIKLYNPEWTSFGYLASAQGPFRPLFTAITHDPWIGIADWMNVMALVFVGITLILGIFEKWGALVGMFLLALYYLAHPSFPWVTQLNVEGSYWFVNKNLIELMACFVLYQIPTGYYFGLGILMKKDKELTKTELS
ncbi:MAG: DoxX family membrane protein [Bacteroidota bacterium]